MIDIYISSFFRIDMTRRTVKLIHERTKKGTFQIHIFDNGSDEETQDALIRLLRDGQIVSLHLDSRNTGCMYNKGVYHMQTPYDAKYYCVTDNDIYPPKLSPDWLSQMIDIMESHPDIGFLAPQLPPQSLQMPLPYIKDPDVVYCRAVGNTLKIVRREAFQVATFKPELNKYGDDAEVCKSAIENKWRIAFCKRVFCYHAGQCEDWGYTKEQVGMDPRKSGYGKPFVYPHDYDTFEPPIELRM